MNEKKAKEYKKVVEEIRISEQRGNIQDLESQKGQIGSIIDKLMSLFLFIYERMPQEPQVKIYA